MQCLSRALALAAALIALPAQADLDGDVSLIVGYAAGGSFDDADNGGDLDLDNAAVAGIAWRLASRMGGHYEIYYLRQDTEVPTASGGSVDIDVTYLQFGGNYPLTRDDRLTPYAVLTVGGVRYDPKAAGLDSETFFALTGGVGLDVALSETFSLQIEGRAYGTWLDGDSAFFCVSDAGATCAITATGDSVWQWAATAGLAWKF